MAYETNFMFFLRSTTPTYIHKDVTPSDRPGILIKILKGGKDLSTAVDIGELLSLNINGPGMYLNCVYPHCVRKLVTNTYFRSPTDDSRRVYLKQHLASWTIISKSVSIFSRCCTTKI